VYPLECKELELPDKPPDELLVRFRLRIIEEPLVLSLPMESLAGEVGSSSNPLQDLTLLLHEDEAAARAAAAAAASWSESSKMRTRAE